MESFIQGFGFNDGDWGPLWTGTLVDVIREFKDLLHGVFCELMVSHSLLHSTRESFMPDSKDPFVAATSIQLVLTHIIYYVSGESAWLVCEDPGHRPLEV